MGPQKMAKSYKLPKHLLEMKFMKKTKEKEERQQEDQDRQTMYSNDITSGMLTGGVKFVEEPSLVPLLGLREGRFSYLGMNPEIEKLMASEEAVKLEEEERRLQESREKSVTDKEMAEHYGTLAHSMGQKFKSKRLKREEASHSAAVPGKKFKFVKPEIDDYK